MRRLLLLGCAGPEREPALQVRSRAALGQGFLPPLRPSYAESGTHLAYGPTDHGGVPLRRRAVQLGPGTANVHPAMVFSLRARCAMPGWVGVVVLGWY
eukprot:466206-Rhodomonas_salina.5